jgi:hypothetical protein
MKRFITLAFGLASVLTAVAPAIAGGPGAPQDTSVFPTPRDPWASWGVQPQPNVVTPGAPGGVVVTPGPGMPVRRQPFWVHGQWVWDGYQWVWYPGHWVYY